MTIADIAALCAAAEIAQEAYDACECDACADQAAPAGSRERKVLRQTCSLFVASLAADEALEAAKLAAMPTWYVVAEDGQAYDVCSTLAEAREEAADAETGDYGAATETHWSDRRIYEVRAADTHEAMTLPRGRSEHIDTVTVTIDPPEPRCVDRDTDHEWSDDVRLVGGIKENPGVWGHGGGVTISECCLHCGCRRVTDTWAQRPDAGEQGLRSVSYDEGFYAEALAERAEEAS